MACNKSHFYTLFKSDTYNYEHLLLYKDEG